MKIRLLCIGAVKDSTVSECIARYAKRIPFYWPFEIVNLPDVKTGKGIDAQKQKELEGDRMLAEIGNGDFLLLLDERGRCYTSREFADYLNKKGIDGNRNLVMAVGGPYGFCKRVYDRADGMLSLSSMTFPHELVRLFLVEQIYRAGTILRGEPYHHD